MLPIPFKTAIDRAFQRDRNLPRKFLGAAVVGVAVGAGATWHVFTQEPFVTALVFSTLLTGACVCTCIAMVVVLSVKDAVQSRMERGEAVSRLLILCFASGRLSIALWIIAVVSATLLACTFYPVQ